MSVTIKDVAKLAGVSPSTVSRVIANNPRISPATSRKVKEAMEHLGYHPNVMAKSLVSRSTQTLGIILPRSADELFLNPFFPEVLRGINAYANYTGYDLLMSAGSTEQEEKEAFNRMVFGGRVDGVILLASRVNDPLIPLLKKRNFPFVLIGRSLEHPDIVCVDTNNVKAAYDATMHLIKQGHVRIGFISGPRDLVVSQDRIKGYQDALKENNLPFHTDWVFEAKFLLESGYQAISTLFEQPEKPTALVVSDDLITFGVLRGLYELNYRVPEDVALVSFNNVSMSDLTTPPLTTIDIGIYHLGYTTAQLLIKQINEETLHQKTTIIPHRLVIRQSSIK
ncbi:LacI family transcriptional regulator [Microaerobacter geothermalis]|uniref:LacI family DNA-binding transcriptional regulator n=1 Tax=Microaerobacter geothermalis TaxID=674972 RepID=UPI001F165CCC|nr:LacI family DNA-binding transcriptional regulator [Microaerobacter geothermalis]MCF6094274.1 LacI family transcriptional regulator [Microaerobacter geothermalis]